jgi:hypothetical protein
MSFSRRIQTTGDPEQNFGLWVGQWTSTRVQGLEGLHLLLVGEFEPTERCAALADPGNRDRVHSWPQPSQPLGSVVASSRRAHRHSRPVPGTLDDCYGSDSGCGLRHLDPEARRRKEDSPARFGDRSGAPGTGRNSHPVSRGVGGGGHPHCGATLHSDPAGPRRASGRSRSPSWRWAPFRCSRSGAPGFGRRSKLSQIS